MIVHYIKVILRRLNKIFENTISLISSELLSDKKLDAKNALVYECIESEVCEFSLNRPICMFAHYSRDGGVDNNVIKYLTAIVNCNIDIVFISTCERIQNEGIELLLKYCGIVVIRKNLGYDFFSWKIGCRVYPDYRVRPAMFWLNDSVIIEERGICSVIGKALSSDAGMFGITDCYRYGYHLQSYFLRFNQAVARSQEFHRFLESIKVHHHKPLIIKRYEIGISHKIGLKYGIEPLVSTLSLHIKNKSKPLRRFNPTIDAWMDLITIHSIPFAKRELITKRNVSFKDIECRFNQLFVDTLV